MISRRARLFTAEQIRPRKDAVNSKPGLYEDGHFGRVLPLAVLEHPDHLAGDAQFLG